MIHSTKRNELNRYLRKIRSMNFEKGQWTPERIRETRDFLAPWSHNIRLPHNIYTAGCDAYYPSHRELMRTLNDELGGRFRGRRILDIGCLEGYFSFECARQGADVIGVDGRIINIKKCEFVRSVLKIRNADFRKDDAMRITQKRYGDFDVVLALGLLYHLENPWRFLKNIRQLCAGVLLLETLVATDEHPQRLDDWQPDLSKLQPISFGRKTYYGKYFQEFREGTAAVVREFSPRAALRNDQAVWLTLPSLVQMLKDTGFESVRQVHFGSDENIWWRSPARVLLVARASRRPWRSRIFESGPANTPAKRH